MEFGGKVKHGGKGVPVQFRDCVKTTIIAAGAAGSVLFGYHMEQGGSMLRRSRDRQARGDAERTDTTTRESEMAFRPSYNTSACVTIPATVL